MEVPVSCPCVRLSCPRHGDCAACEAHHITKKKPPYCRREKKDRAARREERREARKQTKGV